MPVTYVLQQLECSVYHRLIGQSGSLPCKAASHNMPLCATISASS